MVLYNVLVDKFAKAAVDKKKTKKETTVYGTVKIQNGKLYVMIDGTDILTPVYTTSNIHNDDRVMIQIKDHSATIIGNISNPSASSSTVNDIVINQEMIDRIANENKQIKQKLNTIEEDLTILTSRVEALENSNK